jgi:Flp pilus assembly protein TadD
MMIGCRRLLHAAACAVLVAGCAHGPREDVAGAQRALARELVQQRDWHRGFAMADELCRSSPRDPEGFLLRGIVYREQQLFAESEGDLKEALRLDSKSARAHSALAILYDLQSRPEDAVKHHRRAAELEPGDPKYLNNLGFSLFARGSSREAIEVLHQAVRASPADARIRNNLGFAYAGVGDLTRAAEQFAFGGTPAEAKNNLGWAYERRGALAQAFDLYVEALRLDPGASAARKNLTRVAKDLGRKPPPDLASPPGA